MSGLCVDAATREDLEALLEIERVSYSHPWTARNFRGELDAGAHAVFLVLRDAFATSDPGRGVRGYCAFQVVAGEMHLQNLTVTPPRRRLGLGRFLLGLSLDLARRRGAREAFLEVREGNSAALALYRAGGFTEAGRRKGYYRHPAEDALLLRRRLEPLPGAKIDS